MSDTLLNLIANPAPYDPYTPLAKMAQIGQTNVATQGAQLANQQTAMQLAYRQALLAPVLGQAGGNQSLASMASGGPGAPGAPASPGALASMTGSGGGAATVGNSVMSPAGIPLPPMVYASAAMSQNPDAAFAAASTMRFNRLHELATSPTNAADWDANVMTALQEGWITPQQAAQWHGNYQSQARVEQATASPDATLKYQGELSGQGLQVGPDGNPVPSAAAIGAKGAIAGVESNARNASDLNYKPQLDAAENPPLISRAGGIANAQVPAEQAKPRPTRLGPRNSGAASPTNSVPGCPAWLP